MPSLNPQAARCALLADRHHGLSEGVRGLLKSMFEFVVMVADEDSLIDTARRLQPALAIVDLSLGRTGNLAWLRGLREACPTLKIIVISTHDEPGAARAAAAAGADRFVLKRAIPDELIPAVEAVLAERRAP